MPINPHYPPIFPCIPIFPPVFDQRIDLDVSKASEADADGQFTE